MSHFRLYSPEVKPGDRIRFRAGVWADVVRLCWLSNTPRVEFRYDDSYANRHRITEREVFPALAEVERMLRVGEISKERPE